MQAQLIEDLLHISRIIHSELRIDCAAVNLIDIITAAADVVRPKIEAKRLQFEFLIEQNQALPFVWGDADRLQQVFWNLLSNAAKFMPEKGRVTVRLERIDQIAQITVIDTGVGIRADFLPYVFDRFRQAGSTSTRSYSGLGLGLAIARYLVEQHSRTIQAKSFGEGQGATFIVSLPLLQDQEQYRLSFESS
ncbi:MAG: ATP-binding protein [Leptolyngbya sp. Prado105]|nr:ATP-binding protein [Leptolyngbya sp. Prado105]